MSNARLQAGGKTGNGWRDWADIVASWRFFAGYKPQKCTSPACGGYARRWRSERLKFDGRGDVPNMRVVGKISPATKGNSRSQSMANSGQQSLQFLPHFVRGQMDALAVSG